MFETKDQRNDHVIRAAANTLANISLDHQFQSVFLKEPEKSILIKNLKNFEDLGSCMPLVMIFTNICTNNELLAELATIDNLTLFLNLDGKEFPEHDKYYNRSMFRSYISNIIAALSVNIDCRKLII